MWWNQVHMVRIQQNTALIMLASLLSGGCLPPENHPWLWQTAAAQKGTGQTLDSCFQVSNLLGCGGWVVVVGVGGDWECISSQSAVLLHLPIKGCHMCSFKYTAFHWVLTLSRRPVLIFKEESETAMVTQSGTCQRRLWCTTPAIIGIL